MIIKCTMREGITEADIEGYRYTFRPDAEGNPLCNVTKDSHILQFLNMGPHCYVQYNPPIPHSQMAAKDILALPDGEAEELKAKIRADQARADQIEADKAAKEASSIEKRVENLEEGAEDSRPDVKSSAAASLAEARIKEIINSFRTLSKKRFESWIENNRDQVSMMPPDVIEALAKKILKVFPGEDPQIPGLDLNHYADSSDTTD